MIYGFKTTKFRDLRSKYIFNKSFSRLPIKTQFLVVTSEYKLRKLNKNPVKKINHKKRKY